MPNTQIIDYLKQNKDKFSFQVLRDKMVQAGYPYNEIEEAARMVYGLGEAPKDVSRAGNFWDFRHKKKYVFGKEKLVDLIAGIGFAIILRFIRFIMFSGVFYISYDINRFLFPVFLFFLFVAAIIYGLIMRKYLAYGIIVGVILNWILFGFRINSFFRLFL